MAGAQSQFYRGGKVFWGLNFILNAVAHPSPLDFQHSRALTHPRAWTVAGSRGQARGCLCRVVRWGELATPGQRGTGEGEWRAGSGLGGGEGCSKGPVELGSFSLFRAQQPAPNPHQVVSETCKTPGECLGKGSSSRGEPRPWLSEGDHGKHLCRDQVSGLS